MASFSNFKSTIVAASNEVAGVSAGVTIYATRDNLPSSGNEAGDQAYVTGNNRLYIWNGSGWYNIALLNVAPAISAVLDSDGNTTPFFLAIDGTPTTITITAADSDGDPITYVATADSGFAGLGTISQDANVFTITPFSSDSATTTSGTITFTATDGINVASSGVQTFTLNFVSAYWDETVLSIGTSSTNGLANSTFIDRSTNAHTVTTSGSPVQTAFHPYLDYYSMSFDADNSITVPTISSGNGEGLMTTGNTFTLESWVKFKSFVEGDYVNPLLTSSVASGTSAPWGIGVCNNGSTKNMHLQFWDGSTIRLAYGSTFIELGTWYHMAFVVNSGKLRLFLNGVEETVTTNMTLTDGYPTIATPVQTTGWHIGQDRGRKSDFNITNWRLVNGTAVYTENFTPPTTITDITGTWMMLYGNNREDKSSNSQTVASYFNPPPIVADNPFGQLSEYAPGENKGSTSFDGSSLLSVATPAAFNTGDYTMEGWLYCKDASGTWQSIISRAYAASDGFRLYKKASATELVLYKGSSVVATTSGANLKNDEWVHFAVVRNSSTIDIYINGVSKVSVSNSTNTAESVDPINIGGNTGEASNYPFNGYISDLKIIAGTASYTSAFTPPTSPVGSTNAELYLPMDNAGIYDKTGNNTLTLAGNTATSTTQTKFADTAVYFDGTGDYITIEDTTVGNLPTDFTIEGWFNFSALSTNRMLIENWASGVNGSWQIYWRGTGTSISFYNQDAGTVLQDPAGSTITTGTWYHIAVCRSGSTIKLFIDGNEKDSATFSTSLNSNRNVILGRQGSTGTNYFQGYMEDVQILKGAAKYTTNFTPPTQTQGREYQAES